VPVVFAFLIIPITLIALGLMAVYGWVAVVGVLSLLLAFAGATVIHGERVGGMEGTPAISRDALPWRELGGSIALDAAGVAAGCVLIALLLLVLTVVSGYVR
jgi:hypothetical protein